MDVPFFRYPHVKNCVYQTVMVSLFGPLSHRWGQGLTRGPRVELRHNPSPTQAIANVNLLLEVSSFCGSVLSFFFSLSWLAQAVPQALVPVDDDDALPPPLPPCSPGNVTYAFGFPCLVPPYPTPSSLLCLQAKSGQIRTGHGRSFSLRGLLFFFGFSLPLVS